MKSEINVNDIILLMPGLFYDMDNYIRVTKVKGKKIYGASLSLTSQYDIKEPVPLDEIRECFPPFTITSQQVEDIICGKITVDDLLQPFPVYCFQYNPQDKIIVTPEQMLQGLNEVLELDEKIELTEYLEFLSFGKGRFYDLVDIKKVNGGIRFLPDKLEPISEILDDLHLIDNENDMHDFLDFLDEDEDDSIPPVFSDIYDDAYSLKSALEELIETMSLPVEEREYEDEEIAEMLDHYLEPRVAEDASDAEIRFVRKLVEEAIDHDDITGMVIKGRACAGGSRLYDCDWFEAEELFLKAYEMTHSPANAIDLGLLYSAGHTTGGVPDLEKAFFYLCIADHLSMPAASLELCRLYMNESFKGYNPMLACLKAEKVCTDTRDTFLMGHGQSYYPDAMLQMSQCLCALPPHLHDMYHTVRCTMIALFAARLKSLSGENENNDRIVSQAQHMLDHVLDTLDEDELEGTEFDSIEQLLSTVTSSNVVLHFKGKRGRNGTWKITVRHMEHEGDAYTRRFFLALPEYGFTGFTDKLIIRGDELLDVYVEDEWEDQFDVYVDDVRDTTLYYGGREVLDLVGTLTIGRPELPKNKRHMMADVSDDIPGATLECICSSTSICVGDKVEVMSEDMKMEEGIVEAVYWKNDWELSHTPDEYLHVKKLSN